VDSVGWLLTVNVPADAQLVQLLRTVVAGVGARTGLTYDAIDDLRLAVQEAAGQILQISTSGASLTLRVELVDAALRVEVSTDRTVGAWPPPHVEGSLAWTILTTLADDVSLGGGSGAGAWVRLVKPTGVDRDDDRQRTP
jgi:serine/threonine-protein kinase RsbW